MFFGICSKLDYYYFTGKISPLKGGTLSHWLTRKSIREKKGCLYTKIPGSWFIINPTTLNPLVTLPYIVDLSYVFSSCLLPVLYQGLRAYKFIRSDCCNWNLINFCLELTASCLKSKHFLCAIFFDSDWILTKVSSLE